MYSINLSSSDKNQTQLQEDKIIINGNEFPIDVQALPQGGYSLKVNNNSHHIYIEQIDYKNKVALFNIDNKLIEVQIEEPIDLLLHKMGINTANQKKVDNIKAPMPGLILKLMAQEGETIKKGQPILVLEAMKMENVFKSPVDAIIKTIKVKEGEAVEKGAVMIELM